MHGLYDQVSALMRDVGQRVILPRHRRLRAGEVIEKTPGELVTVVDREAEARLTEGLLAIDAGIRIVGEEACAADPALLDGIGRGAVWIVDPLDGTANFAAGTGAFGIIIALVVDGETRAGWLYDPVRDRMCHAVRGGGAFLDGVPLRVRRREGVPVATLATQFMTPAMREAVTERAARHYQRRPIPRCAAEHYPLLCLGDADIALFQRTLPWDHAAGALLLQEAGGRVGRWDGSPYRVGDGGHGLLATASAVLWDEAAAALLADPMLRQAELVPQALPTLPIEQLAGK